LNYVTLHSDAARGFGGARSRTGSARPTEKGPVAACRIRPAGGPPGRGHIAGGEGVFLQSLQAQKELQIGNFYFKTGKYRSAAMRFTEATKWNEGNSDAWLRLGETEEKLKDSKAAKEAYTRYLALASDAKNAPEIRKKLQKLK
jgi:tetratricopeptide (TPR) repeat protein